MQSSQGGYFQQNQSMTQVSLYPARDLENQLVVNDQGFAVEDNGQKLELFIGIRDLFDDSISGEVSVKLLYRENGERIWRKLGKTNHKNHQTNPNFDKSIPIKYYFERFQTIKLKVKDKAKKSIDKTSYVCKGQVVLGMIMSAPQ